MTENTTASGAADDSLLLCAADLQHSAIYDNPHEMVDCVRAVADRITALAASTPPVSITLDFKQATELLGMYGGEPTEVTLMVGNGHSGKGVYAHWTSVPEEEAMFLGASNDEAAPVAPAPQPAPMPYPTDAQIEAVYEQTMGQHLRIQDALTMRRFGRAMFLCAWNAAAPKAAPAPVAEDAEDAANWKWLAAYLVGPRTDRDDEIVASESVNALRKLVSAARAHAAQPEGGAA